MVAQISEISAVSTSGYFDDLSCKKLIYADLMALKNTGVSGTVNVRVGVTKGDNGAYLGYGRLAGVVLNADSLVSPTYCVLLMHANDTLLLWKCVNSVWTVVATLSGGATY